MDLIYMISVPLLVATASALVSYHLMHARMEVAVARERQSHAATLARLHVVEQNSTSNLHAVEEGARRRALEQFLSELHVEERTYLRESRSVLSSRHALVTQERLFFRDVPLSNWIEHEMHLEGGGSLNKLHRSVFNAHALSAAAAEPPVTAPAMPARQALLLR
jgi:hypothetical protein